MKPASYWASNEVFQGEGNPLPFVEEIQRDAREGMVPIADITPLLNMLLKREDLKADMHFWNEVGYQEKQLRAKHPHLFTKTL